MMDFVLGSLFFFIFEFAIMHGTDWNGIIGIKGFFNPTTLANADGLSTDCQSESSLFPYSILRHIRYYRIRFYGRTYKIPCLLII